MKKYIKPIFASLIILTTSSLFAIGNTAAGNAGAATGANSGAMGNSATRTAATPTNPSSNPLNNSTNLNNQNQLKNQQNSGTAQGINRSNAIDSRSNQIRRHRAR